MPRPFGSRWVGQLYRAGGRARDRVDLAAADGDISELAVVEPHQLFVGPLISAPALVEPDDGSPEQHVQSPSFSRGTAWNRPASWFVRDVALSGGFGSGAASLLHCGKRMRFT